jgi:uncharacterized phage protein gp47/JayE
MADAEDPDRPSLTGEDLDRIRARMLARANLGIDPTSALFLDAIIGSVFGDLEIPAAVELDQLYDFGEVVVRAVIPSTASGTWLDDWAESLGLERRDEAAAGGIVTFTGAPGSPITAGQQVTTTAVGPDGDPIAFQVVAGDTIGGGGSIDLEVSALVEGSAGNVAAGSITIPSPSIAGVTAITNALPMTGGADVEDDELLSDRVDRALTGDVGAGTISDYERWLGERPGIGFVTVRPVARGPGTVDVYITDLDNNPMPPDAVAAAQEDIDPTPRGHGLGRAPINADVLILTPDAFATTIVAVIQHETGYSLDGAAATRATRAAIEAAIGRYIDSLGVGDDIVRNKLIGAIVEVRGVANVVTTGGSAMTVNTLTSETVAVPADEIAAVTSITLT